MSHVCIHGSLEGLAAPIRLSYKFQRLRERIRTAVLNGDFGEKLPGERELARRYNANAKTINKALCDLSSEGILVRQIGRGTFVAAEGGRAVTAGAMTLRCYWHNGESNPAGELVSGLRTLFLEGPHRLEITPLSSDRRNASIELSAWSTNLRRETDCLVCAPPAPLDHEGGHFGEDLILEAHRRHVPLMVIGAFARNPKLNAVAPDHLDGGYRLAEHLFRLGCEVCCCVTVGQSREVAAAVSGVRTAAGRYRASVAEHRISAGTPLSQAVLSHADARFAEPRVAGGPGPRLGLLCIGATALRAVLADRELRSLWRDGRIGLVALVDPGDQTAAQCGVTAYEINPTHIVDWGARLMKDARPGHRPVEIVIPGALIVRNTLGGEDGAGTGDSPGTRRIGSIMADASGHQPVLARVANKVIES